MSVDVTNWRTTTVVSAGGLIVVAATIAMVSPSRFGPRAPFLPEETGSHTAASVVESGEAALASQLEGLRKEHRALQARLNAIRPHGSYLVVDRGNNRIYLRRGDSVLVDAPASTGSGAILREMGGQRRTWTFDTPSGSFRILAKRSYPVWIRPDWAFLEVGEPIPTRLEDRFEYGALGEYGLYLGHAYLIHGTLYERLLGRGVTHGCVRVGRDPLREIARRVAVGTQVFIY